MKLRTKLILAFLLMSVLPLTVIVLYSYFSSIRSLRMAALAEVLDLTVEIGDRIGDMRDNVDRGVEELGVTQFGDLLTDAAGSYAGDRFLSSVGSAMGEAAQFVESLEFVPSSSAPVEEPNIASAAAEKSFVAGEETGRLGIESVVIHLKELSTRIAETAETAEDWVDSEGGQELLAEIRVSAEAAGRDLVESVLKLDVAQLALEIEHRAHEAEHRSHVEEARALVERQRRVLQVEPMEVASSQWAWKSNLLAAEQLEQREAQRLEAKRILGREFDSAVEQQGKEIGRLKAQISAKRLLQEVLQQAKREQGEIPFAVDGEGNLYLAEEEDREKVADLRLTSEASDALWPDKGEPDDWVIVRLEDPESRLVYGIARPIGRSLADLRRTAGRNFLSGLGLVCLALVGIVPLSRRITRDLNTLAEGAEELATGNLDARVRVSSRDEVGDLASTFNLMAEELQQKQHRLLEQERLSKENEIQRRLLEAENLRKGAELEAARKFQLSLLPKRLPEHPDLELAVFMKTATEVGGDYYDFHMAEDGTLTVAVGDATGHGASAGTMVTVIKSLFTADAADAELPEFLMNASNSIKRMELGRMAMALTLMRYRQRRLTLSAAGMPPLLVHRSRTAEVEELGVEGVPLGAMSDYAYRLREVELETGDMVLLMSDGFPELTNESDEPLGYSRVRELFRASAASQPQELIADLSRAAEAWVGASIPSDDITFVALQVKARAVACR